MPYLPNQVVTLRAGQEDIVQELVGVQEAANFVYTYTIASGSTLPGTLALGTGIGDTDFLYGTAPTDPGFWAVDWQADIREGTPEFVQDPDAPYTASIAITVTPQNTPVQTIEGVLQGLDWRDLDEARIGIQHSNPRQQYIFMGLPTWALSNSGPSTPEGDGLRQWLPIENIQEAILPAISSNTVPRNLSELDGDYIGSDFVPHGAPDSGGNYAVLWGPGMGQRPSLGPTIGRGKYRTNISYGPTRLRILWNEEFASHGGPYGLRQAAMNQGLALPFAHLERNFDFPAASKVRLMWWGFVSQFTPRITRRGYIVDVVIENWSGLTTIPDWLLQTPGRYGYNRVSAIHWPARHR